MFDKILTFLEKLMIGWLFTHAVFYGSVLTLLGILGFITWEWHNVYTLCVSFWNEGFAGTERTLFLFGFGGILFDDKPVRRGRGKPS